MFYFPSGKLLHNCGKSPLFKLCQIHVQSVQIIQANSGKEARKKTKQRLFFHQFLQFEGDFEYLRSLFFP
jgi:hypothetical protein